MTPVPTRLNYTPLGRHPTTDHARFAWLGALWTAVNNARPQNGFWRSRLGLEQVAQPDYSAVRP